jgi:hypothetical protein
MIVLHSEKLIDVTSSGVNPAATPHELAHYFTITAPKAIFGDPELIHDARGGLQLYGTPQDQCSE